MNVFDRLYEQVILEFSEGATKKIIQKFSNEASEQDIRRELDDFEKYKGGLEKKDPFQYKSWIEFTEAIHAAKGKAEFKKKKIPDKSQITSTDDIIADDENVTIYKGDSQDKCVMYGKGYTFCISRQAGGNMFSSYRLGKESTFYFIYFKNKPKNNKDHIMVLDHTNEGYVWTFADNDTKTVGGGWNEIVSKYPELKKYERLLVNKKLDDNERNFIEKLSNFSDHPSQPLELFNQFSYKEKAQALKSVVNLSDNIWKTLDSTLRNEFLSIGPNLTDHQADDLKPNEIKRYKNNRIISIEQLKQNNLLKINNYDSLDTISRNSIAAYNYAHKVLNGENVPDIILKGIARESQDAYNYANLVLKWENVPDIIMNSIITDPFQATMYATNILNGVNVPSKVLNYIANSSVNSYKYASFLNGDNVPEKIIRSISLEPRLAFNYVTVILHGKNVPDILLNSIQKDINMREEYLKYLEWKDDRRKLKFQENYKSLSTFDKLFEKAVKAKR